ncbi:hypothetical protein RDABS01_019597 [Bienertia sinuspersici]
MGALEGILPAIAMVSIQVIVATMALLNRVALVKGMNPRVFIFYRLTIATFVICPIAYFNRKGGNTTTKMGFKSFILIFITACIGLEQVSAKTLSSAAKILGTIICVGGAITMAMLRGPKLLNAQPLLSNSLLLRLVGSDDTWLLGCLCLFASACCWSSWLILQVPLTASYPNDHISLSGWMCFLSMLQAGAIALFFERDPSAWNLSSSLELTCCFVSGVFGSGVQFFIQSWCISRKGPFYSATFTPLATVITTILACLFVHEQLYLGSLLGAIAVIIGLYVVIWGKSEELKQKLDSTLVTSPVNVAEEKIGDKLDLEQPLLTNDIPNKDDVC